MKAGLDRTRVFKRKGEPVQLNFQNRDGYVPPYQGPAAGSHDREVRITAMRYLVELFWSEEDGGYITVVPDLPGCSAFGATPEAAVHEIGDAIEAWIAACRASGDPVPEPTKGAHARQAISTPATNQQPRSLFPT
jgi:predicted RNase H-like HicB family nuclease